MSATALASETSGRGGTAPFAPDGSERLEALFAPIRGMSRATLAVLAGSVALHLALVATAIVTSRTPPIVPAPQETAVEVVQEVPNQTPNQTPKETLKEISKPQPIQKAEAAKVEAPEPEPVRPPPPQHLAQAAPPKAEAPKVEASKLEPPKPASVKEVGEEREALLKELAALRAQESKLEARQAPTSDLGMGPLPDSFQAVALPSSSEAAGEAMDYKAIVFSELAKAKGLDERMGLPGTAGVRFDIDGAGGLVAVEIVRPSGVAVLDREALAIVRRAAPFPVPPQGAQRSFVANFSFVAQGDQSGTP